METAGPVEGLCSSSIWTNSERSSLEWPGVAALKNQIRAPPIKRMPQIISKRDITRENQLHVEFVLERKTKQVFRVNYW